MYTLVLGLHSWLRWVALIAAALALYFVATERDGAGKSRSDRWGLVLMIALDLQLVLGVLLYFWLSPFITEALGNMAAAMKDSGVRKFVVEHPSMMLVAIVLAHVGRILARKAKTADDRRMRLLICFGLALLLMLISIPWPGMAGGRQLFRI